MDVNTYAARQEALYKRLQAEPKFQNLNANGSYLRQDVLLENNKDTLTFDFKDKRGSASYERLLKDTDVFVANSFGLFICVEETAKPGTGRLITFPNDFRIRNAADTAGGAAATAPVSEHLNIIYSGYTNVMINQKEVYTALENRQFLNIPPTQENGLNDWDSIDYRNTQMPIFPGLVINAIWDNRITVKLPTFNGNLIAANKAGWQIRLAAVFNGMIIPGAAQQLNTQSTMLKG